MPSKKKKYNARFPAGRIKKIMQTDDDVGKVAQAVPVIISRTLELFVESLLTKAQEITSAKNAKTLSPSHMKQCILSESRFDFLKELVASLPDVTACDYEESNFPCAMSSPQSADSPSDEVASAYSHKSEKVVSEVHTATGSGRDSSTLRIGKDSSTLSIGKDSSTLNIGKDSSTLSIGKDSSTLSIGKDSSTLNIGKDSSTLNIGKDSSTLSIGKEQPATSTGVSANFYRECEENNINCELQTILSRPERVYKIDEDYDT